MIIDSELISIAQKAETGDAESQRLMAVAYLTGKGVPQKDQHKVLYYYLKMAEQDPDTMPQVGYGSLLCSIGNRYFDSKNYFEAVVWYRRSIKYIKSRYVDDFAEHLINHLNLEKSLEEAITYNFACKGNLA